jgi:site-specific DNA-methyltransferase (adenine-specific)/modification methylase
VGRWLPGRASSGTLQGQSRGEAVNPVTIGDATLYLGDCRDILPTLPKVDLVLTDPPFGVGNFVQVTGRIMGRGKNIGKTVEWNNAPPPKEIFDHLREMSKHRIIWGANFFNSFEDRGGAIVWIKNQPMPNFSKADIASCTHYQKTEIVNITWRNFEAAKLAMTDHPCERPIALYEWCLQYIPNCTGTVLDPYLGSGSVAIACANLHRKFIGIEINPSYFDAACDRLDQFNRQMLLTL